MPTLSSDDIRSLSRLARLQLTPDEEQSFAGQLSEIVNYVDQLSHVNTSTVGQLAGVTGLRNILASDTARSDTDPLAVDRERLLAGVPRIHNGLIQVRAVLVQSL